jgi:predicted amidohydrolase YtcJ
VTASQLTQATDVQPPRRKSLMLKTATFLALLLSVTAAKAQQPLAVADSIYFGGTIITVDDKQPSVEAVAVRGGNILAVGTKKEVFALRGPGTNVVDLHGHTLLPGFVDGHSHFGGIVSGWGAPNLNPPPAGPVETIADIQRIVRDYIAKENIPAGVAVSANGYDDSALKERRHPTRVDLDAIATDRPLCLRHVSGHLATCNSAALKAAGITVDTPDPAGGRIFRNPTTREPTGVLGDRATALIGKLFPVKTLDDAKKNFAAAQQYYASFGYTTVQEGASDGRVVQLLRDENASGALKLDVISYPAAIGVDRVIAEQGIHIGKDYDGHLKFAGVKIFGDGSPQGKTAFLRDPYIHPPADAPADYRGLALLTQEQFNEEYDKFFQRGWQVQTHCNGDACIDRLLTAVSLAEQKYGDHDRRPVVIHSQVVRPEQLDKYVELHIVPSFFEAHTFYWGDWHRDEILGPQRAAFISPLHTAQAKGIVYSIHSDAPVVPPNAMFLWWAAVNRRTRSNQVLGPAERVDTRTALKALTIWPAYQQFDEKLKGTLEPGKYADFVILAENPLTAAPLHIKDIAVLETIKNGHTLWKRSTPVTAH